MTIKQIIIDIWNKRYLNSKERYARQEKIAQVACFVVLVGLMFSLCLMMLLGAGK
jgi:hypothetical protein